MVWNYKKKNKKKTFQLKSLQQERCRDKISLNEFRVSLQTLEVTCHFPLSVDDTSVLHSVFYIINHPPDLCCIFLQRGIEEAQLRLQERDEIIHQVGTETSLPGNNQSVLIYIDLSLCSSVLISLSFIIWTSHVFMCVFFDRKSCSYSTWRKQQKSTPTS